MSYNPNGDNIFGYVVTLLSIVVAIVLLYFVVQGALYIGWAVGGVIGVVLALLIIFNVLPIGGFLGSILALFLLIWIIDYFV